MPIPQKSFFSCGVGVSPAQKFDEKEWEQEAYCLNLLKLENCD
jgi:hypothetical protein